MGVIGGCGGLGLLMGANAHFVKGYSIIWLVGGAVPLATSLLMNKARQPN